MDSQKFRTHFSDFLKTEEGAYTMAEVAFHHLWEPFYAEYTNLHRDDEEEAKENFGDVRSATEVFHCYNYNANFPPSEPASARNGCCTPVFERPHTPINITPGYCIRHERNLDKLFGTVLRDEKKNEVELTTPEKHPNEAFTASLVNILKGLHVDKGDSPPSTPHKIDGPITNDDYYEIRLAKSLFKFLQELNAKAMEEGKRQHELTTEHDFDPFLETLRGKWGRFSDPSGKENWISARQHLTNLTVMMALHDIPEHPEEDKGSEGPPDLVDDADNESERPVLPPHWGTSSATAPVTSPPLAPDPVLICDFMRWLCSNYSDKFRDMGGFKGFADAVQTPAFIEMVMQFQNLFNQNAGPGSGNGKAQIVKKENLKRDEDSNDKDSGSAL